MVRWTGRMVGVAGLWGAALVLLAASTGLGAERFALRQPPPNDDNVVSPSDIVPQRAVPPADAVPYASDPYSAGPHVQKGWSCPPPCVKYHHHGRRACETYQTVVTYCDPCTGCTVQVPICVPVCCGGAPVVCERSGLFGRSIVVFQWCCGFKAKIIGDRCGNLTVHTYGR